MKRLVTILLPFGALVVIVSLVVVAYSEGQNAAWQEVDGINRKWEAQTREITQQFEVATQKQVRDFEKSTTEMKEQYEKSVREINSDWERAFRRTCR
jgi:predicted Holliday junction resolvase-like endonuclease